VERHDQPDDHLADSFGSMDALDKIEWMIESAGWALDAVAADLDAEPVRAGYAYSINLPAAVGFAEVVVFGLTPVAAKGLVTLVADAARSGTEIPIGVEVIGLFDNDLRCLFAPVDLGEWGGYFAAAEAWYRGAPFEVVQMLYPDRNGFMPYEAGYEQRMTLAQPVIGTVG
jgi:hypothetical protein